MHWVELIAAGVLATMFMDGVAVIRHRLWGIAGLDYALVGRWLGHMARGQFRHQPIVKSPAITGERALGWAAHYAIGGSFAVFLGALVGAARALEPSFALQFGFGLATVSIPFLVMMPCLGFGVFARKTPNPARARQGSLIAHASFGVGLYLAMHVLKLAF